VPWIFDHPTSIIGACWVCFPAESPVQVLIPDLHYFKVRMGGLEFRGVLGGVGNHGGCRYRGIVHVAGREPILLLDLLWARYVVPTG
jgi:hypothetical protein